MTSGAIHCYISQTDKGEVLLGGDLDGYNSYAQRGNLPVIEHVSQGAIAMYPALSRLRVMRSWGGVMDMTMDGSPIIGKTPVENLFIDGGWCYGGFKATPGSGWVFAHTIAHGEPHDLNAGLQPGALRDRPDPRRARARADPECPLASDRWQR